MRKILFALIVLSAVASTACGDNYKLDDGRRFVQGNYPGHEIISMPPVGYLKDGGTYVLCNKQTGKVTIVVLTTNGFDNEPWRTDEREMDPNQTILCGEPAKDPKRQATLLAEIKNVLSDTHLDRSSDERYKLIVERFKEMTRGQ